MEIAAIVAIGLVILFLLFKIFKAFLKWAIVIVILALALAYFTNPGESEHRDSLDNRALKKIRKKLVAIDDYKLFSLTKVTVDGKEKIIGIGAFGKVWYFDDLEENLRKK